MECLSRRVNSAETPRSHVFFDPRRCLFLSAGVLCEHKEMHAARLGDSWPRAWKGVLFAGLPSVPTQRYPLPRGRQCPRAFAVSV